MGPAPSRSSALDWESLAPRASPLSAPLERSVSSLRRSSSCLPDFVLSLFLSLFLSMASTSQLPVPPFFFAGSSEKSLSVGSGVGASIAGAPGAGPTSFMSIVGSDAPEKGDAVEALIESKSFFATAMESASGAGGPPVSGPTRLRGRG